MKFTANWQKGQPQSKLYKFGYEIDADRKKVWKSDGIKNTGDFRTRESNMFMNPDRNLGNVLIWVEISDNGIQRQQKSNIGTTYSEINIIAQDDTVSTSRPPTVSFKNVTLRSIAPSMLPPEVMNPYNMGIQCQILSFDFEKVKGSWEED